MSSKEGRREPFSIASRSFYYKTGYFAHLVVRLPLRRITALSRSDRAQPEISHSAGANDVRTVRLRTYGI